MKLFMSLNIKCVAILKENYLKACWSMLDLKSFHIFVSWTKNFLELIERKKQYFRLLEYPFNLKKFYHKKYLSIIHLFEK